MFPVLIVLYVVIMVVVGNSPRRCPESSWTVIADVEFRQNVSMLHQELYDPERKPERPQFDRIYGHLKQKIENENSFKIDFDDLDAVILDIGKLQSELKRLSQELNILDDYEDEGGVAAYLNTVRAESHQLDEKFLFRIRHMNRPMLEKVEELNQIYSRNQNIIKENESTLASRGASQYELQQLRDPETQEATESHGATKNAEPFLGSSRKSSFRSPLSWHLEQSQDDDSDYEKRSENSVKVLNSKIPPAGKWGAERWAEWVGGFASPAVEQDVKIIPPKALSRRTCSRTAAKGGSKFRSRDGSNGM